MRDALDFAEGVGLRPLEGDEPIDLYEIVRVRYARWGMILTSNRALEEWYPLFCDDLMASAAMDRMLHHAPRRRHGWELLPESA